MDEPKLSILIPTIRGGKRDRTGFLNRLMDVLKPQCVEFGVPIIVNPDDGSKTTGLKRNELLDECQTDYCAFIDDDDLVPSDYIHNVMEGIKKDVDVISFTGIITAEGRGADKFIHRLGLTYSDQRGIYFRPPNHLNPMKTAIARQVRFKEVDFGEDKDFCERLAEAGLLKTEHFVDSGPMYYYQYRRNK